MEVEGYAECRLAVIVSFHRLLPASPNVCSCSNTCCCDVVVLAMITFSQLFIVVA